MTITATIATIVAAWFSDEQGETLPDLLGEGIEVEFDIQTDPVTAYIFCGGEQLGYMFDEDPAVAVASAMGDAIDHEYSDIEVSWEEMIRAAVPVMLREFPDLYQSPEDVLQGLADSEAANGWTPLMYVDLADLGA